MKKIFQKTLQDGDTGLGLLILRAAGALMMLTHGIPKLMQLFSGEPIAFASVMGLSMGVSLALAVFSEVVCSVLVLLGLGTRLAAIPLLITMLTAAFHYHAADPFTAREPALLYGVIFLVILVMGGGKYSVDSLLSHRLRPVSRRVVRTDG